MNKLTLAAVALLVASCRNASVSPPGPPHGKTASSVTVSSSAFSAGQPIPPQYTCDGADQSPELSWTAVPDAAKSVAIIVDDPDAPSGTFTHWILWNIEPGTRTLGTGGSGGLGGGTSGTNDFDHVGYSGPCPPKGALHHYHFSVYGLDTKLTLRPTYKRPDLDRAMNGHVIAKGELVGTFQH
jgi:Raf kinase inhibitor-like YbhB/YbcL family protein